MKNPHTINAFLNPPKVFISFPGFACFAFSLSYPKSAGFATAKKWQPFSFSTKQVAHSKVNPFFRKWFSFYFWPAPFLQATVGHGLSPKHRQQIPAFLLRPGQFVNVIAPRHSITHFAPHRKTICPTFGGTTAMVPTF